jgi:hypothetical protein
LDTGNLMLLQKENRCGMVCRLVCDGYKAHRCR